VAAAKIFAPFIFLLNGFGNWMLKLINIEPAQSHHAVHTEEELDMIIEESFKGGVLNETESFLLKNSLKFTDLTAKQVMIPRCNMISMPVDIDKDEYAKLVLENQYTRYPVYSENLDNIVGILHVKDLYSCQLRNQEIKIKDVLRQPVLVPETMTTDNLLEEFKKNKTEIAVVIDEFGGVAGIVTMEDILEEVFGSVQDEFDDEENDIKQVDENKYIVNGLYRIEDFSEYFELQQEEDEDVETIGGLMQKLLCRLAKINDEVMIENLKLRVVELKARRIKKILVERIVKEDELQS
jgi:CBS domain containing-hemolysin-like protein